MCSLLLGRKFHLSQHHNSGWIFGQQARLSTGWHLHLHFPVSWLAITFLSLDRPVSIQVPFSESDLYYSSIANLWLPQLSVSPDLAPYIFLALYHTLPDQYIIIWIYVVIFLCGNTFLCCSICLWGMLYWLFFLLAFWIWDSLFRLITLHSNLVPSTVSGASEQTDSRKGLFLVSLLPGSLTSINTTSWALNPL